MTREEQLACLKDRPCDVCKMRTDKGCSSWECVFEQTPDEEKDFSEDCISREEVCDYIAEFVNHEYATDREREMVKNIIGGIQHLPSIQPKPKTEWISVSERLPGDGQSVLFCDNDDDIMLGYHVKGRSNTHFSQDGTYEDMKNVRAWMPLPEPYKAEKE